MVQKHITQFIAMTTLLLHCVLGSSVRAEESVAQQPLVHQADKIRVIYYTEGPHAISSEDTNLNRIPDQAEDILTQTLAAYYLFVETLGFQTPYRAYIFILQNLLTSL